MRFRDRIWIALFVLVGGMLSTAILYEYLYVEKTYIKKEDERMNEVFHHYEKKLEDEIYLKEKLLFNEYLIEGNPQIVKLRKQNTFVFVAGKKGHWKNIDLENLDLKKMTHGYIAFENGRVLGYKRGVDGTAFIFKLDVEKFLEEPQWNYYKIYMTGLKESRSETKKILLKRESIEKEYYIPITNGRLSIKLKRGGLIFRSIHLKGQKIYLYGIFFMLLLTLVGARYFEKTLSNPINKAIRRMNSFSLDGRLNERISLGDMKELKGIEDGLNRILGEIEKKKKKYELLYEEIPNFTAILDIDLNIIETNSYFDTHLKKSESIESESILSYIPDDKINLFTSLYKKIEKGRVVVNEKFYMIDKDLNIRDVLLTLRKVVLEDGEGVFLLSAMDMVYFNLLEIDSRIKKEKYDRLTNVYTREYGGHYLERYISLSKTSNFKFTTAFVWLDSFSEEENGYEQNSRANLLKVLADNVKDCLRGTDLICKFERNNFMLLMPMVKKSEADMIFKRITEKMEDETRNLSHRLRYVFLEYSGAMSKDDFIQKLVEGMRGKRYKNKGVVENKIIKALQDDEIKVYFEPLLDLGEEKVSLEALLRWKSPYGGVIYPYEFLPVAEESGLLPEITRHVLKKVCAAMDILDVPISINISVSEFIGGEFLGAIKRIFVDRAKLKRLELEIPEIILMEDLQDAKGRVIELNEMGVTFNLDHFGSGGGSLLKFKELNLKRLKTDKTFIEGIEHSKEKTNTLKTIIGIGRGIEIPVSVVGVGGRSQARKLVKLGCRSLQGEYIGEAVPIESIKKYLVEGKYKKIIDEIMEGEK